MKTSIAGPRTGGRTLVDQLQRQGIERLTCVPGESYLAVLDALYGSGIDVLVCRHESGAPIVVATQLRTPDFAAYARVFGGLGERVECTEEFAPAVERARASGNRTILQCLLDPRALSHAKDLVAAGGALS